MGIGIDLVLISRFLNKQELAERVLSKKEYALYLNHPPPEQFAAGRCAAKEAFIKAYDDEAKRIPFQEIEILPSETGKPWLHYGESVYAVSIAHDGDYAVAVVII